MLKKPWEVANWCHALVCIFITINLHIKTKWYFLESNGNVLFLVREIDMKGHGRGEEWDQCLLWRVQWFVHSSDMLLVTGEWQKHISINHYALYNYIHINYRFLLTIFAISIHKRWKEFYHYWAAHSVAIEKRSRVIQASSPLSFDKWLLSYFYNWTVRATNHAVWFVIIIIITCLWRWTVESLIHRVPKPSAVWQRQQKW